MYNFIPFRFTVPFDSVFIILFCLGIEKLSREEIQEYIEVFEFFGQNKNGCISTKQLRQAMRMIGLNPTDHQVQRIINEKEYDGNGFLKLSDFIKTMEEYKKPGDKDDLIMAFKVFDPQNRGYVEVNEIKKAFQRSKDIPKQEIEEIFEEANLQEDRHMSFEEFSRLLVPLINGDLDIICL